MKVSKYLFEPDQT